MKCIVCKEVLTEQQAACEIATCSAYCRQHYYRNSQSKREILKAYETDDYSKVIHFKLIKFIQLGYKVLIFPKEYENEVK